jgi:hypothetical protein
MAGWERRDLIANRRIEQWNERNDGESSPEKKRQHRLGKT